MPLKLNPPSLTDASAKRLASEIIREWPTDRPFEVRAALRRLPELAHHKSAIVDLAYEEFCRAKAREPLLAAGPFAARFPSIQKTLIRLLEVHEYLEQNSEIWGDAPKQSWPSRGMQFLEFRLIAELGRGTLSRVFIAEDSNLANRQVVVKVTCHVEREAGALGRLQHPNIVPVLSVRRDPQSPFSAICMPFLGRATLVDVLDAVLAGNHAPKSDSAIVEAVSHANGDLKEPVSITAKRRWLHRGTYVDGIVRIGAQLAEALAYAHDQGIFHCDVKPSNVLITAEGTPMLLDFNLALSHDLATMAAGGTLPYMAPEQLRWFQGGPQCIDARSDVFSLGVTLCELLTGQLPFGPVRSGVESPKTMAQTLLDAQRERECLMAPGLEKIDPAIAQIIQRCLALDLDDRPSSARELAIALRATQQRACRFRSWCRAHRAVACLTACSVIILATAAVAWGLTREPYWDRQIRTGREAALAADYEAAGRHFTNALQARPDRLEALLFRGYSQLKAGMLEAAYRDLLAYSQQADDGRGSALLGFCLCMMPEAKPTAIVSFEEAIQRGFVTAALENDLGYLHLFCGEPDLAKQHLSEAARLDPTLTTAHFNLCLAELRLAVREKRCPDLQLIDRITGFDVPSAECHLDVACFLARAAGFGEPTVPQVLSHCRAALAMGAAPEQLRRVASCHDELENMPAFVSLLRTPAPDSPAPPMDRLIDPLFGTDFYLGDPDFGSE